MRGAIGLGHARQQLAQAAGPEGPLGGEIRLGGIHRPANDQAAHAAQAGIAVRFPPQFAVGAVLAQGIFRLDELLREAVRFVIGIIVPASQCMATAWESDWRRKKSTTALASARVLLDRSTMLKNSLAVSVSNWAFLMLAWLSGKAWRVSRSRSSATRNPRR